MKLILFLLTLFSASCLRAQTDTLKLSETDSVVYYRPEIEASYPGGVSYWARFLQRNLQYPSEAQSGNVQGTVVTFFMVDTNGAVHDVTAISGPKELRAETIRIIELVDIWIPAMYKGRKVNSWKKQQVTYRLER